MSVVTQNITLTFTCDRCGVDPIEAIELLKSYFDNEIDGCLLEGPNGGYMTILKVHEGVVKL